MAGLVQERSGEKRMEKQIGCMSGFLQIFDRQQILAGKRIHSTKRLPPSTGVGASPETESSGEVNEFSRESEKPESHQESHQRTVVVSASTDSFQSSFQSEKVNGRRNSPAIAPTVADGEKTQRRSPSVIARLMGLEPLSCSDQNARQTVAKPALGRSVSESKVSGDPVQSKYIDDSNFQVKIPNKSQRQSNVRNRDSVKSRGGKLMEYQSENLKAEFVRTCPWRSRSFFDSADFFPEPNPNPNQTTMTMHGDFEKRLKMRGMSEQSNDLSTLKQILEVLQLKGLLHSRNPSSRDANRNFVYDGNLKHDESSVVLVEPWRFSATKVDYQSSGTDSRGTRGYASENYPAISRAIDRSGRIPVRARTTTSSPNRIRSNLKNCNSIIKRKPLSIEIGRENKHNDSSGSPKRSPIDSLKYTPKRNNSVQHSINNRARRNHKPTESSSTSSPRKKTVKNVVSEDESSSISESIFSTPSTTDSERSKHDGYSSYREGKSLLHRCDKLIHSITEMNSTTESPPSSAVVLPSPVSVLDSQFDSDDSPIPSLSIDFKACQPATPAIDFPDDGNRSTPKLSPTEPTQSLQEFTSKDSNFTYISKILQSSQSQSLQESFFSIEKQFHNTQDTSDLPSSKLQRKLVFDLVCEIIDKISQLPPWIKVPKDYDYDYPVCVKLKHIWSEFRKIRETNVGDGVLESVIKRDLVETNDWRDCPIETPEIVLDIERMIFKDLVSEAIRDLAEFSGECMLLRTRRKLVF